jgi:CheY-like chemotaxis protein
LRHVLSTLSTGFASSNLANFAFDSKQLLVLFGCGRFQELSRLEQGNTRMPGDQTSPYTCFGTRRSMQARILFLDDNEDLRELMPALLKSVLGVELVCFGNLTDLQNHKEDVLSAKIAIIDINLGPNAPDGIDAFNWLIDHGFRGKVLFLTGHARSNPKVARAVQSGAEVLEKPLHPDQLIASVIRALRETS